MDLADPGADYACIGYAGRVDGENPMSEQCWGFSGDIDQVGMAGYFEQCVQSAQGVDPVRVVRRREAFHPNVEYGVVADFDVHGGTLGKLSCFPELPHYIREMGSDQQSVAIIQAVIGLGASLDMATVAEGVETRDEFDCLRAFGCTEVQGYYISPPRPASEVALMLSTVRGKIELAA